LAIFGGASANTIGGTTAAARNLISGNSTPTAPPGYQGVGIADAGTTDNVVEGNFIGTDLTGRVALANLSAGLSIADGASGNTIGGTGLAANIISGNGVDGVDITDQGTTGNEVDANLITGVTYGSANGSVKITLAMPVRTSDSLRLTINAQPPSGLLGTNGQFLNEAANGTPGANAVIYLGAAPKTPPPPKAPKTPRPKAVASHLVLTPPIAVARRTATNAFVGASTPRALPVTAGIADPLERDALAGLTRPSAVRRAPRRTRALWDQPLSYRQG
jgi:hypothetical protein